MPCWLFASTAKSVMWLHSHVVWVAFEAVSLHPSGDHFPPSPPWLQSWETLLKLREFNSDKRFRFHCCLTLCSRCLKGEEKGNWGIRRERKRGLEGGREGVRAKEEGRAALGRREEGRARDGGRRVKARGRKNEGNLSTSSFLARFLVLSPSNQCHVDYCEGPQYRFFGIWDFPSLKLGFRDFKAKSGRYSVLSEK